MIEVAEALRLVLATARPLPGRSVAAAEARGCYLAAPIAATADSPPFDKALVDGYALRSADHGSTGPNTVRVVETIAAGRVPTRSIGVGEATFLMTGATLPEGADAVVMHERTSRLDDGRIAIPGPVVAGLNRLPRGREHRAGAVILDRGSAIDGVALGLLAALGVGRVEVGGAPAVAIVATGDELVDPHTEPGPGQIRNANATLLAGLLADLGQPSRVGPIVPDDRDRLCARFADELTRVDLLIVSGGVSAGTHDLVPAALAEVGATNVFHKVRVKPGKPLWFGVGPPRDGRPPALIFGLPGNPISGLVSVLLFVAPALRVLAGGPAAGPRVLEFPLATDFAHRGERPTYHPARLESWAGGLTTIRPLASAGSADLGTLVGADGFAAFAAGDRDYEAGSIVPFLPLPEFLR